jgi:hypothetical protein
MPSSAGCLGAAASAARIQNGRGRQGRSDRHMHQPHHEIDARAGVGGGRPQPPSMVQAGIGPR